MNLRGWLIVGAAAGAVALAAALVWLKKPAPVPVATESSDEFLSDAAVEQATKKYSLPQKVSGEERRVLLADHRLSALATQLARSLAARAWTKGRVDQLSEKQREAYMAVLGNKVSSFFEAAKRAGDPAPPDFRSLLDTATVLELRRNGAIQLYLTSPSGVTFDFGTQAYE